MEKLESEIWGCKWEVTTNRSLSVFSFKESNEPGCPDNSDLNLRHDVKTLAQADLSSGWAGTVLN